MKIIKFREDTHQDAFYTQLREQVGQYLAAHGYDGYATPVLWFKAALYAGLYFGLYVWMLTGAWTLASGWWLWAGIGLTGVLLGLNFAHDAAHDSFFKNKQLNKVLYYLSFNALGANAYLWKMRHVDSHHLFPNVEDCDADIDDNPIIRLSPYKPLFWYHRFQHLYAPLAYLFYSLIWVFYKDFSLLRKKQLANLRDIKHPPNEIAGFFLAKALYVFAFLIAPWYLGGWSFSAMLGGFLILHFVSGYTFVFGLAVSHFADGRSFPQVDASGYLDNSWSMHQILTSLDYHATQTWANWIFGGFNAHAAHHLFPKISHVHYPRISKFIQELAIQHEIPYENTTWAKAIAAHFRYLKRLGQESIPAFKATKQSKMKSPPPAPNRNPQTPDVAMPQGR